MDAPWLAEEEAMGVSTTKKQIFSRKAWKRVSFVVNKYIPM
jgi:hypothetical protein